MKKISEMNAGELADLLNPHDKLQDNIASRLRAIHDLTRWIPVSERMPTEEDAINGYILYWYNNPMYNESHPLWSKWKSGQIDPKTYPYWICISTPFTAQRITPPTKEGE